MSDWKKNELALSWGSMNVWTAGSGRNLIALHGLGGSGRYWHGLARHLVGWRVVAPDLAGFGRSDKPALRYNRTFHLETIKELVAWTGETPVLLGHSGGQFSPRFGQRAVPTKSRDWPWLPLSFRAGA